jgi:hypothetical protein
MSNFTADDALYVKEGSERIFVGGNIDYDDGFENQVENSYCFRSDSLIPAGWDACPIVTFADLQKMKPPQ